MVINVSSLITHCYTYEEGLILSKAIIDALSTEKKIQLSFKGINAISSSFINGAFIPVIKNIGLSSFMEKIKIIDSNKTINEVIKLRLMSGCDHHQEAAASYVDLCCV